MANANLAVAAFENRNNVSLGQINLDFALVKYDAPPEYSQIGRTISKKRKESAEAGSLHRTARLLGEIFKDILPKTDRLLRCYGTRASEIASKSSVNPRGTQFRDGLFSMHIGIDTASIWAAATSGGSSLAVHLLACMLARIFAVEEATSIWFELVEKQKEVLQRSARDDLFPERQPLVRVALARELTRQDLSEWDASARAWLQSADEAKPLASKQLQIIINDASIPVNSEPTTYGSVTSAWISALTALDNLLGGVPQLVRDGAALLAISAWHLYPDMLVFRGANGKGVEVSMKDPLFESTAVMTLGLELLRPGSVCWSLPLARLQYYGEPVQVTATAGHENTRVSPVEFSYIVLGGILYHWGPPNTITLVNHGQAWLRRIIECAKLESLSPEDEHIFSFLTYLHSAARGIRGSSDGVTSATAIQLFKLGARRSRSFLFKTAADLPPPELFDLHDISRLLQILNSHATKIKAIEAAISLPDYNHSHPAFLFVSRPEDTNRLVLSAGPNRWIGIRRSEIEEYRRSNVLSAELETEIARQPSCLPALIPDEPMPDERFQAVLRSQSNDRFLDVLKQGYAPSGWDCPVNLVFWDDALNFYHALETFNFNHIRHVWHHAEYKYLDGKLDEDPVLVVQMIADGMITAGPRLRLDEKTLQELITPNTVDPKRLQRYLFGIWQSYPVLQTVSAFASASSFLQKMPGATISTAILERPFEYEPFLPGGRLTPSTDITGLPRVFGLCCYLTSGCYVDPMQLCGVFAIATGNSLYVASVLLNDPHDDPDSVLTRVIGNVGRPGICFLFKPSTVKISRPVEQNWRVINHSDFDGKLSDSFQNTTVHLSFTEWEVPVLHFPNNLNKIDVSVRLLETVVSAFNGSKWVADLDIVGALAGIRRHQSAYTSDVPQQQRELNNATTLGFRQIPCESGSSHAEERAKLQPNSSKTDRTEEACGSSSESFERILKRVQKISAITVIDNWDEILDPPTSPGIIIRSSRNWLARLSLLSVCHGLGYFVVVANTLRPCWAHLLGTVERETRLIKLACQKTTTQAAENEIGLEKTAAEEATTENFLGPAKESSAKRKSPHERPNDMENDGMEKKLKQSEQDSWVFPDRGLAGFVDQFLYQEQADPVPRASRWQKFAIIL